MTIKRKHILEAVDPNSERWGHAEKIDLDWNGSEHNAVVDILRKAGCQVNSSHQSTNGASRGSIVIFEPREHTDRPPARVELLYDLDSEEIISNSASFDYGYNEKPDREGPETVIEPRRKNRKLKAV